MRELEVVPGTVLLVANQRPMHHLKRLVRPSQLLHRQLQELTPGILTPVPKVGGGSAITGSVEFPGSSDY